MDPVKMPKAIVRSPSRYILNLGLELADVAVFTGLRAGGCLYSLASRVQKEEARKVEEAFRNEAQAESP